MATMQAIAYIKHFALQKETEKVKISWLVDFLHLFFLFGIY